MSLKKIDCDLWSEMYLNDIFEEVRKELIRSEKKHGPLGSPHEMYAVPVGRGG